jgi:lipoate-protein ligase A
MAEGLRVVDTGERSARYQIAFGQMLIDRHRAGAAPDTLRFMTYPPSALVARDQPLYTEVAVDWCRSHGVAVARRLGGGATLYAGPGQLGWDLVVARHRLGVRSLAASLEVVGGAIAAGLAGLAVPARFRAPGRIDGDGRRLGSLGGFFDGETAYFQGLLLVALEPGEIMRLLTVPGQRLIRRGMAEAAARLVTLATLCGAGPPSGVELRNALAAAVAGRLGLAPVAAPVNGGDEALASQLHDTVFGQEDFIDRVTSLAPEGTGTAACNRQGSRFSAQVTLSGCEPREIAAVRFIGNYLVSPPDAFDALALRLRGRPVAAAATVIEDFFTGQPVDLLVLEVSDICAVLEAAMARAGAPSVPGTGPGR